MLRGFFGNLIFAIIARMLCENHLKYQTELFQKENLMLAHHASAQYKDQRISQEFEESLQVETGCRTKV